MCLTGDSRGQDVGDPVDHPDAAAPSLGSQVRQGLAWSVVGGIFLRSGNLLIGIVLARLLAPQVFGVFAVALTVMSVLMTLADLGLTADLVRSDDFKRRAPTVSTLSLVTGAVLTVVMIAFSGSIARSLGAPSATHVVQVLSLNLLLSGLGVEPNAMLLRSFRQKTIFHTNFSSFIVSNVALIVLVLMGWGPMALAITRVLSHAMTTALQFLLTRTTLRLGFDKEIARSALRFGVPVAGVNLIAALMLGLDNIVIARVLGDVALGFYVLAFNISNWPTTVIGNAIANVSLPAFSRTSADRLRETFHNSVSLTWSGALFIGVALVALADPLIRFVYGDKWLPSGNVLGILGLFGALKVVFDLAAQYLFSQGSSRSVMWLNLGSIVVLAPAMIIGAELHGIDGGATARLLVGVVVTLPLVLLSLRAVPGSGRMLVRAMWPPLVAAVPAGLLGRLIATYLGVPVLALVVGGLAMTGTYYLFLRHRVMPQLAAMRSRGGEA